jgi:hypothetical protein
VHVDVWEPFRETSLGGVNYMLNTIDNYSRKLWCFFLKHKFYVFDAFRKWKDMVEKQSDKRVELLRTENGLEFCSIV